MLLSSWLFALQKCSGNHWVWDILGYTHLDSSVCFFSVPGVFFLSGVSLCRDIMLTFLITMQVERLRIQGEHLERSEQIQYQSSSSILLAFEFYMDMQQSPVTGMFFLHSTSPFVSLYGSLHLTSRFWWRYFSSLPWKELIMETGWNWRDWSACELAPETMQAL